MMAIDIVMQTGGNRHPAWPPQAEQSRDDPAVNTGIAGSLVFGLFRFELLRPRRGAALRVDVRPYHWLVIGLIGAGVLQSQPQSDQFCGSASA